MPSKIVGNMEKIEKTTSKEDKKASGASLKTFFVTGLILLLPLTLTLIVVSFIFNLLTGPFLGITNSILNHYGLFGNGFLFLNADQARSLLSQVLILVTLVASTILLGALARWIFFPYMVEMWEALINKIPFVKSIYKTSKDLIQTLFTPSSNAFKKVVMVRFPNQTTQAIGLVSTESVGIESSALNGEHIVVFVPTTPNPTSGFLIIVNKADVVPLDMKVEEAFKYIISCGVITSPHKSNNGTT